MIKVTHVPLFCPPNVQLICDNKSVGTTLQSFVSSRNSKIPVFGAPSKQVLPSFPSMLWTADVVLLCQSRGTVCPHLQEYNSTWLKRKSRGKTGVRVMCVVITNVSNNALTKLAYANSNDRTDSNQLALPTHAADCIIWQLKWRHHKVLPIWTKCLNSNNIQL